MRGDFKALNAESSTKTFISSCWIEHKKIHMKTVKFKSGSLSYGPSKSGTDGWMLRNYSYQVNWFTFLVAFLWNRWREIRWQSTSGTFGDIPNFLPKPVGSLKIYALVSSVWKYPYITHFRSRMLGECFSQILSVNHYWKKKFSILLATKEYTTTLGY